MKINEFDIPYDIDIEKILEEITNRNAKKVLIQLPDGLKPYASKILEYLSLKDVLIVFSTDPCYGSCYIADYIGKEYNFDLLIHIGHDKFVEKEEIPTVYITANYLGSIEELAEKATKFLYERGFKKIGLVTNYQHLKNIEAFSRIINSHGLEVIIDEKSKGLVLGCKIDGALRISEKVDVVLYLGGGDFHALGIAMAIDKPLFIADPYRNEIRDIEKLKKRVIAQRWWAIHNAKNVKNFGIVLVSRRGQFNEKIALDLKYKLEEKGKKVTLLISDNVNWDEISSFTYIDVFIVTGCPRISIDNRDNFKKPILNIEEAYELIKVLKN
ncbi:MAG: diphthamide biosynthesis enzyme Dph2 [Candidatus Methanomethylicota archaeon]|jgi:2-(3-amino-3-carboxypropyl)histidine synthase|uniref:2-(3-amino-3-carboxypropyl)histidine synthase n=1 Tax=Thermoproteota archaeon TaxID=2056631 RepID=A0A520KGQ2_9CREN|nr:MAG: diphthamide biosynthesis enzyme Dph2 [Candidatus Verstraetearchaeota archaeon]TDA37712.1 MAG: diphthamide biosynthesis enzyme Dph2 [Candidatus Verstraetearchaeota archaeon]